MATEKQMKANRANSQFSTGPRSQDGKERVKKNALKHGLLSKALFVNPEEQEDLTNLTDSMYEEYQPQSCEEKIVVDRIISLIWRIHCALQIEAGFNANIAIDGLDGISALLGRAVKGDLDESFKNELYDLIDGLKLKSLKTRLSPAGITGLGLKENLISTDSFDRVHRYMRSFERDQKIQWRRLEELQSKRREQEAAEDVRSAIDAEEQPACPENGRCDDDTTD